MVRIFAVLVVLGFVGGALIGCHAAATVDPHGSSMMAVPK